MRTSLIRLTGITAELNGEFSGKKKKTLICKSETRHTDQSNEGINLSAGRSHLNVFLQLKFPLEELNSTHTDTLCRYRGIMS